MELRKQLDSPAASGAVTARQKAARKRAAESRQQRLEQAIAQLPELKQKQAEAAQRAGQGKCGDQIRAKQPRVSTTDAATRVMKMANGGYSPGVNVQLATDTQSRAILGVEVSNEGSDSAGLSEPIRQQVEQRTGGKVEQHLVDGGYLRTEDIVQAHQQGVESFVPSKPARNPLNRGRELEPKPSDSEAVQAWKRRMASKEGQEIYKQRAATSETVNADLRTYRGLAPFTAQPEQNQMRDAVVRLGLQPDALQQSVAELKPGCRANAEQNRAKRRGFDTTWQAVPCDTVPRPDGRLAVRALKNMPLSSLPQKTELSHRLSG